jgi:two-component system nitrate/nitrite sensor histidine kinase NarX
MAESRWIAYELHDGLMQWVIGARMHIAALVSSMKQSTSTGGEMPEDLEGRLTQILSYLNQASEEGRQLIRFIEGLAPTDGTVDVIETLETTAAILTRKSRDGRPMISFKRPERPWPELQPQFAWCVVRIIQQAAVNAVRHSQAEHIAIILGGSKQGELCVSVIDDGKGFDPCGEYPGHFGLQSMRQRARENHWDLAIDSQPDGGGTRVVLRIPVQSVARHASDSTATG